MAILLNLVKNLVKLKSDAEFDGFPTCVLSAFLNADKVLHLNIDTDLCMDK